MAAVTATLCSTLLFVFVSAEQKNITADFGQNITLPCRTPNNNIILGAEWSRADLGEEYVLFYRDGRLDPGNQHPSFKNRVDLQDRQMKDGDVSVILKNVMINDSGTYECRVVQTGTKRSRRAILETVPISIIYLRVVAPPGPGGAVGVIVGLSVSALLLILLVAVVGFMIYRKHKHQQNQNLYQSPSAQQDV
ncbi:programmed cell death 1 ligand 1-like [Archocentrus centrarchus]|uniref:programmed cell death 1 ligand 1-like n=1 Tax=Archocentrus centrarchus TaxID=63155 RepID=UPI0011E9C50F|nr:programmed cell death 1 ligand 1-like [Archocentrus centrarchus]